MIKSYISRIDFIDVKGEVCSSVELVTTEKPTQFRILKHTPSHFTVAELEAMCEEAKNMVLLYEKTIDKVQK